MWWRARGGIEIWERLWWAEKPHWNARTAYAPPSFAPIYLPDQITVSNLSDDEDKFLSTVTPHKPWSPPSVMLSSMRALLCSMIVLLSESTAAHQLMLCMTVMERISLYILHRRRSKAQYGSAHRYRAGFCVWLIHSSGASGERRPASQSLCNAPWSAWFWYQPMLILKHLLKKEPCI